MNREIKFRAKLLGSGALVYFDLFCLSTREGILFANAIGIDPNTIQLFTGLQDKNGKEAYGGDLYYFSKYSTLPSEIYWDDRWCGWRGRINGEMQADKTYDISPLKFGEVIGNIYETPELLEKT